MFWSWSDKNTLSEIKDECSLTMHFLFQALDGVYST